MARETITPQTMTFDAATAITLTDADNTANDGYEFQNNGTNTNTGIMIVNGSASPTTATLDVIGTIDGGRHAAGDLAVTVAAGTTKIISNLTKSTYNQSAETASGTDYVLFKLDTTVNTVKLAIIKFVA